MTTAKERVRRERRRALRFRYRGCTNRKAALLLLEIGMETEEYEMVLPVGATCHTVDRQTSIRVDSFTEAMEWYSEYLDSVRIHQPAFTCGA